MNDFAGRVAGVLALLALVSPDARADNSMFVAVTPCRIVDTRFGTSPSPIAGNTSRKFDVVGVTDYSAQGGSATTCGIPGFSGNNPVVTAVAMNVVAVKPAGQGNLVVFPSDATAPTVSTLNFAGPSVPLNIANGVIIPVRQDTAGNDVTVRPTQSVDVVIDVTGYFTTIPLRARLTGASPGLIGGFSGNSAAGTTGAVIAGGGESSSPNTVSGSFGAVGGGESNTAGPGTSAVVGGGIGNTASGNGASVPGGQFNTASGDAAAVNGGASNQAKGLASAIVGGEANTVTVGGHDAVTIGGDTNTASARAAVVLGGEVNQASGRDAVVVGGSGNTASGLGSFAAGNGAQATHDGSFVWADNSAGNFSSNGDNTFRVRATGGVRFVTTVPGSFCAIDTGGNLSCSGTISQSSDRDAKRSFAPVDGKQVLRRVAALPIRTWTFKADKQNARHLGPMAQDFRGAFQLGADDRHIATVDEEGVALAAIQGLYAVVREQGTTIERKDRKIAELEARLEKLESKVGDGVTTASSR